VGGLKKGDALGRYLVLEQLGAGAMGVVYAAYDPELDRKIAIKILRPQEGKGDRARRQERLVREAKAMAKLSHPNVGAIYDVGVHGDQVFLAMEFLSGGTLRDWVDAKKRPWREIVRMFIEVGKGLAGAHAEGLIHRDFKPDNVLLDKNGVPKVVDFGLVRLTSAALDRSTSGSMDAVPIEETDAGGAAPLSLAQTALADLTRTGALTGTPAYMAAEQFLGKEIDARTDQFAFSIALYEALYGERPFAGETVIGLADAVTCSRIQEAPKDAHVPPWIRRVLLTGLQTDPGKRYQSLALLVSALLDDPQVRRRKQLVAAGAVLAVLAVLAGARYWVGRRQRELDRQIAEKVQTAEAALAELPTLTSRFQEQRRQALRLFDTGNPRAEAEWQQANASWAKIDAIANAAFTELDAARALRPSKDIDTQLTGALVEHARRNEYADRFDAAAAVLSRIPGTTAADSFLNASLSISVNLYPAHIAVFRYEKLAGGRLARRPVTTIDVQGPTAQTLQHGSYLLKVSAATTSAVDYPLFLRIGETATVTLALPPAGAVPAGFSYVPSGRFLFGEADESLRTGFTNSAPLHEQSIPGFLIAKHELTFAEWIAFLRALPASRVTPLLPRTTESMYTYLSAAVDLRPAANKSWRVRLMPVSTSYAAAEGEDIVYAGRDIRARQNWLRMPVTGIAANDIEQYAKWLDVTGRLPGARLCAEDEWERAARGADDRRFPHGNVLAPDDANHDVTYGRVPTAFGPDEVGSHPDSRSPFDLDDMAGNAWEITSVRAGTGGFVLRGGGYYHNDKTALVTNREPFAQRIRNAHVGTRICAALPKEIKPSELRVRPN
jgi:formylglycine-generating enzyme required for sulfatase activity